MPAPQRVRAFPIEGVRSSDDRPNTYPKGRVCAADGCTAILSQYNGRSKCWQCRARKSRKRSKRQSLAALMQEPGIG